MSVRRSKRKRRSNLPPDRDDDDRDFTGHHDKTVAEILGRIQRDGYSDVTDALLPPQASLSRMQEDVRRCVAKAGRERVLHTERTAVNVQVKSCLPMLAGLLTSQMRDVLDAYLYGDGWIVVGVQSILVKPQLRVQKFHRDHQHGKGSSLVLAIALDDVALGTLFVPGTHCDHDTRVSFFTADAERIQAARLEAASSVRGRMMIYDPHTVHAGGANETNRWFKHRVFITVASTELSDGDLEDMKRTNSLNGFTSVTRAVLLPMLRAETAGRGASADDNNKKQCGAKKKKKRRRKTKTNESQL